MKRSSSQKARGGPRPGPFSFLGMNSFRWSYFFLEAMISLRALAGRALTTFLAGILMAAPVWGFRPMRALRVRTLTVTNAGEGELVSLFDGLGGQFADFRSGLFRPAFR